MKTAWIFLTTFFLGLSAPEKPNLEVVSTPSFRSVKTMRAEGKSEKLIIVLAPGPADLDAALPVARALSEKGINIAFVDLSSLVVEPINGRKCLDIGNRLQEVQASVAHHHKLSVSPVTVLLPFAGAEEIARLAVSQAPGGFSGWFRSTGWAARVPASGQVKVASCETPTRTGFRTLSYRSVLEDTLLGKHLSSQYDIILEEPLSNTVMQDTRSKEAYLKTVINSFNYIFAQVEKLPHNEILNLARVEKIDLVEIAAAQSSADELIILISGDGGWSDFADDLGEEFARRGHHVVGINLIPYFWEEKRPADFAKDIRAIFRVYEQKWKVHSFRLVGFSHGADILPFAVNRFSTRLQKQLNGISMISPSLKTVFEFSASSWFYDSEEGEDVLPEVGRYMLLEKPLNCVFGENDSTDGLCAKINGKSLRSLPLPGGHHLNYAVEDVVKAALGGK